jgi:hypothetical protein
VSTLSIDESVDDEGSKKQKRSCGKFRNDLRTPTRTKQTRIAAAFNLSIPSPEWPIRGESFPKTRVNDTFI